MFVVDIDPRHGGDESLIKLETEHGKLPCSTTVISGGGGKHIYLSTNGSPVKGRIGLLPGIDIKSTGGYVVAPPSTHKSGKKYEFLGGLNGIATAPTWLIELINGPKDERFDTAKAIEGVPHGQRYYTLIGLAGKLRYADLPFDAALEVMNMCGDKCKPAAKREDVKAILTKAYATWGPGKEVPQVLSEAPKSPTHPFSKISESRYCLEIPEYGISFDLDRIRREQHSLIGELSVKCLLAGARTYDGSLSIADFNLSSERARNERAKVLSNRAQCDGLDWYAYLEELCQRVISAERTGDPSMDLRTLDKPSTTNFHKIDQFYFPSRHPTILFGDGGSAKSYFGLYVAGELAKMGVKTAIFDWELAAEEHRDRLERIYSKIGMPSIQYVQCKNPLVDECDRLRRIVTEHSIEFAVYDSIAFACDGPPESAESAGRYFRSVRQIGIGSLHIAHVTKTEFGDQKPFGSVFWHNGARSTYYAKLVDDNDVGTIKIGIFHRKANLGRLNRPVAYEIVFEPDRTFFQKSDPAHTPELAEKMPIRWRLKELLKDGAMSLEDASIMIGSELKTLKRTITRHSSTFTLLDGGKVGLLQNDSRIPF